MMPRVPTSLAAAAVALLLAGAAGAQTTATAPSGTTTAATATVAVATSPSPTASTGSFQRLSSGEQKIARALFMAQKPTADGPAPLNLDQIAALRRDAGWGEAFKEMKASGLVDAKNLGQVVSGFERQERAAHAAEAGAAVDRGEAHGASEEGAGAAHGHAGGEGTGAGGGGGGMHGAGAASFAGGAAAHGGGMGAAAAMHGGGRGH